MKTKIVLDIPKQLLPGDLAGWFFLSVFLDVVYDKCRIERVFRGVVEIVVVCCCGKVE